MEWGREDGGERALSGTPERKTRLFVPERDESGIRREEDEVFSFRHAQ